MNDFAPSSVILTRRCVIGGIRSTRAEAMPKTDLSNLASWPHDKSKVEITLDAFSCLIISKIEEWTQKIIERKTQRYPDIHYF